MRRLRYLYPIFGVPKGGRPKIMDEKMVAMAKTLMADRNNCVREVCKTLGVSRSTLYRYLQE